MSIKTKLMTACAGVVLGGATIASADLKIDLRVADVDGVAVANPKAVPDLAAGQTININIYAIVSGQQVGYSRTAVKDAKGKQTGWKYDYDFVDGFQSVSGSILTGKHSGAGAVVPNTSPFNSGLFAIGSVDGWNGLGSTDGQNIDLTGDGVLDLGAPNGTADGALYMNIRNSKGMSYDPANPTVDAIAYPNARPDPDTATKEFLIGKVAFWVDTPTGSGKGETAVNWALRKDGQGRVIDNAGLWEEDRLLQGANKEQDPKNGTNGNISVGAPIILGTIPEPMSLSVMGLGAALLGFRRNRR